MTVRDVADSLLAYLRREQREYPILNRDVDDPTPSVVVAINAAMQLMAVESPAFVVKQQRSAWFHAPETVAVTGLTSGGKTATCAAWPAWAAGCLIALPGDADMNRVVSVSGTTAKLQYPHMGSASGNAELKADSCDLDEDIIKVLSPVRVRGGLPLRAANGPFNLSIPVSSNVDDYGRRRVTPVEGAENAYFIESATTPGTSYQRQRMMLRSAPTADFIVGFNARCSLGRVTVADIYGDEPSYTDPGVSIPVPADFIESIFLPIATHRFLSSPIVQNWDVPGLRNTQAGTRIEEQYSAAFALLKSMAPQSRKRLTIFPGW